MKIVLLAEHAMMNVLLKQYQKVISIKLIRTFVLIAVLVLMFVRWRQFTLLNSNKLRETEGLKQPLFYSGLYFAISRIF